MIMRSVSSIPVILFLAISLCGQPVSPATPPAPTAGQLPATTQQASLPATPTAPPFGEISGTVKSGNVPLPGVTVTAANTLTGKKYFTSTDVDGSFKLEVTGKGRYVIRAELSAFAPATQEVLINEQNRSGKADLTMVLLSRAQRGAQQEQRQQMAQQLTNMGRGGGIQQLALSGSGDVGGVPTGTNDAASLAGVGLPNAGLAAEGVGESVSISGVQGRAEQNMFDPGEMQDRMADMREQLSRQGGGSGPISLGGGAVGNIQMIGGGFGGGGFGGGAGPMLIMMGGGAGGGRGFRNFNVNKPHGSIFFNYGGSILDAKPYSLNGQPENKASYNQSHFGVTIGGPLNIPHIYKGGTKTFLFGSYTGSRGTNPYDVFSTVPTIAERSGDFAAVPGQLVDPVTRLPLANNQIPAINPASAQILNFIPQPNLPGTTRNFHFVSSSQNDSDTGFIRFNHNFGPQQPGMLGALGLGGPRTGGGGRQRRQQQQQQNQKKEDEHWSQSINGAFISNNLRASLLNPFPTLGGRQSVSNYNASFGHTAVKGLFLNSLRFNYNHSGANVANNFTGRTNIEGQLGINGVSQAPSDFGLPVLNFSPEFSSLQDTSPVNRTTQNLSISDSMSFTHGKHGWTWGGDFRHQFVDTSNASNARGTFIFTGAASGLPFADFLFGFPQETSIQSGARDYHFRANTFDLFVQDNWRAGKNLTLNLGLRYEYVTPFTESNGQLVNLDVASDFSAVAPVLPGQAGPITGRKFPDGLVNPDRNNFAPRVGIAWKPWQKTVVRSGYGINYNIGQYGLMATQLGFQPPFAVAQTNPAPTPNSLTLQDGFPAPIASPDHITNTYAVDPNYRLAYVQSWNLNIQQEIKTTVVVNIGYTGAKGTHLDIVRAPDQLPTGGPRFIPCTPLTPAGTDCVQPFLFESSEGSSIMHQGTLRVRKRLRHGLSVGGTYAYSKSIDDASSIGGGGTVVAQNDFDIAAERSLSSFDQRHRFVADYLYELPFGKDRKWLSANGKAQQIFGGFSLSGNVTLGSGLPFSPRFFGRSTDLGRGVTGAARPDEVAGQPIQLDHPTIQQWFNTAAFAAPAGVFGTAGRNTIIGPGTFSMDMALSKNIQVREMQSLELRLSAANVFNTVHFTSIDTTFGSSTFGQVVSAGSMRKAQLIARYRF
jgi:Carboxypeptidase regulatory-like domain/TonB dependent receptor-like, beta-barrel